MFKIQMTLFGLLLFSMSTQAATIDYLYESEMDLSSLGGSTCDDISLAISYDPNSAPEQVGGQYARYYVDGQFSIAGQIIQFTDALIITANNNSNIEGRDGFGIASHNVYTSMSGDIYGYRIKSFGFSIRGPSTVVPDTMLPVNESVFLLFDANWNAIQFDGGPHLVEENTFFSINSVPEPSTFILLGIGAVYLLAYCRRR